MLILEKVIKLLDDFHYQAFFNHVKNLSKRSYFPLVLIEAVERDIDKSRSIEDLCMAVYGEFDDKIRKKFLQLAHYTFRLTSFLSKNYPDYLQPNISRVQHYINEGQLSKANILADILFEISRKIEDHATEIKILQIQSQQNFLLESGFFALKQQERIRELYKFQTDLNEIVGYVFEHFDPKNKIKKSRRKLHRDFFEKYFEHPSTAIKLISRYYAVYSRFQTQDESFYSVKTFQELLNLDKDFQKNDCLILPYLTDYQYSINYLILEYKYRQMKGADILKEADRLTRQSEFTLFWNSFVNLPELNSIELQSNFYYRLYLSELISGSEDLIPAEVSEAVFELKEHTEKILKNEVLEQMFILQYINLSRVQAQLAVFGDQKDREDLVSNLESILYIYQQVPFHTQVVGIYHVLIVANYLLGSHEKTDELYRRFKRTTKDKVVALEDSLLISAFFYASKRKETKRPQYAQKLNMVRSQAQKEGLTGISKTLEALSLSIQVPVKR